MSLAWSSVKALSIPVGGVSRDVKRVSVGGTVLWEKAPAVPYDAEVEYIESTGTQYVDTGLYIGPSLKFVASGVFNGASGNAFCCGGRTAYNTNCLGSWNDSGLVRIDMGSSGGVTWKPVATATEIMADAQNKVAYVVSGGEKTTHTFASSPQTTQVPFRLFVYMQNLAPQRYSSNRLSSFSMYDSGVLVRDYIPVRVGSGSSAVGYLYDRANPTGGPLGNGLYGNSGSGAFVIGPDAN